MLLARLEPHSDTGLENLKRKDRGFKLAPASIYLLAVSLHFGKFGQISANLQIHLLLFDFYSYNPGQNKLGHWQISMFSSCFLKYRGENIRLEPSHPPSPLIQCWDGRMAFDSTNIETGGAGALNQRLK